MSYFITHIIAGGFSLVCLKQCMRMEGYPESKSWRIFVSTYEELLVALIVFALGWFSFIPIFIIWVKDVFKYKFRFALKNKLPWAKDK